MSFGLPWDACRCRMVEGTMQTLLVRMYSLLRDCSDCGSLLVRLVRDAFQGRPTCKRIRCFNMDYKKLTRWPLRFCNGRPIMCEVKVPPCSEGSDSHIFSPIGVPGLCTARGISCDESLSFCVGE